MTQNIIDFSTDPSGTELLDSLLAPQQQNILSSNSGTSRPSYAVAGTKWINTTTNPWVVYIYDGSSDVQIGTINTTTHVFTPSGLGAFGALAYLNTVSATEIANSAVTLAKMAVAPFTKINIQKFASSGTYTPTTGMVYCIIECIGGGGGGGGIQGTAGNIAGSGGGGAGGYSIKFATAATIGASKTVTIGAAGSGGAAGSNNGTSGGTTSVGSICAADGGSGGSTSISFNAAGGSGANVTTAVGDITAYGQNGGSGNGAASTAVVGLGGAGGNTLFGRGGIGTIASTNGTVTAGGAAVGYGGGGSGACFSATTSSAAGGNGSPGLVVITEFLSA